MFPVLITYNYSRIHSKPPLYSTDTFAFEIISSNFPPFYACCSYLPDVAYLPDLAVYNCIPVVVYGSLCQELCMV